MEIDKENLSYYKDKDQNTEFKLANITSCFLEGLHSYDGAELSSFWLYIPVCIRIKGKINVRRMKNALVKLVDNNQALRMVFVDKGIGYKFKIIEHMDVQVKVERPIGINNEEKFESAKQEVMKFMAKKPDIINKALFYFKIYELGTNDYFLVMLFNHSIIDGQSIGLIMKQFIMNYLGISIINSNVFFVKRMIMKRLGIEHMELSSDADFMDFYEFQVAGRTKETEKIYKEYWKKEFCDLPKLDFANRPISREYSEDDLYLSFESSEIKDFCRKNNVTLTSVIIAAFHYAQTVIFGERDTAITYSVANRSKMSHFSIVGPLTQLISHRLRLDKNDSYKDVLKKTKDKISENVKNQNTWNENIGCSRFVVSFMNQGGVKMASLRCKDIKMSVMPGLNMTMWQPQMFLNMVNLYFIFLSIIETKSTIEIDFIVNPKFVPVDDIVKFKKYIRLFIDNMIEDVSRTVEV